MKKTYLSYALTGFVLLLTTFSCQREEPEMSQPQQAITIDEAKAWFDHHLAPASADSAANGRKRFAKEPVWEYARKLAVKGKEVVAVPLKSKKGYRAKGYAMKLLMSKDKQGKMQTQVMKVTGTEAFLKENNYKVISDNFSGIVEITTWEGKFLEGTLYRDGKVIGSLQEGTSAGGRKTAAFLLQIFVDWYQRVCIGDVCTEWTYLSTTIRTIVVDDGTAEDHYNNYYSGNRSGGSIKNNTPDCANDPGCYEPNDGGIKEDLEEDKQVVKPPHWWDFMYKSKKYDDPCAAYKDMISAGYSNNDRITSKELGGMVAKQLDYNGNLTGNDVFIAFPVTPGDGATHFTFKTEYKDEQGREILRFWDAGGNSYVMTTTYSDNGQAFETRYIANTMVHTHPYDSGNAWTIPNEPSRKKDPLDKDEPDKDMENAAKNSHLIHRIVSREQIIDYNGSGVTNRQANNCK